MKPNKRNKITTSPNNEKMSPQAAVGYGNWPDEDGRQSKYRKYSKRGTYKKKTLQTHRLSYNF